MDKLESFKIEYGLMFPLGDVMLIVVKPEGVNELVVFVAKRHAKDSTQEPAPKPQEQSNG